MAEAGGAAGHLGESVEGVGVAALPHAVGCLGRKISSVKRSSSEEMTDPSDHGAVAVRFHAPSRSVWRERRRRRGSAGAASGSLSAAALAFWASSRSSWWFAFSPCR